MKKLYLQPTITQLNITAKTIVCASNYVDNEEGEGIPGGAPSRREAVGRTLYI